jgi:hypothetical protein
VKAYERQRLCLHLVPSRGSLVPSAHLATFLHRL